MKGIHLKHWQINDGLVVTTSAKVGSTSFEEYFSVRGIASMTLQECKAQGMKIGLYMRHPIERFISCFSMFLAVYSLPSFVERVQRRKDVHWVPQTILHPEYDEVYRFENISETFPGKGFPHLNKRNPKIEIDISQFMDELTEFYRDDLTAWNSAKI